MLGCQNELYLRTSLGYSFFVLTQRNSSQKIPADKRPMPGKGKFSLLQISNPNIIQMTLIEFLLPSETSQAQNTLSSFLSTFLYSSSHRTDHHAMGTQWLFQPNIPIASVIHTGNKVVRPITATPHTPGTNMSLENAPLTVPQVNLMEATPQLRSIL